MLDDSSSNSENLFESPATSALRKNCHNWPARNSCISHHVNEDLFVRNPSLVSVTVSLQISCSNFHHSVYVLCYLLGKTLRILLRRLLLLPFTHLSLLLHVHVSTCMMVPLFNCFDCCCCCCWLHWVFCCSIIIWPTVFISGCVLY